MVQGHASRYALNNYDIDRYASVSEMCSDLQLRGHTKKIQQLSCRVNAYANSFFHMQSNINYGMIYHNI